MATGLRRRAAGQQGGAGNVVAAMLLLATLCAAAVAAPSARTEISIPGERIFPESLTSTQDGRIFIGSILARRIYEVRPGESVARSWTVPDDRTSLGFLGLLADDRRDTLWACRTAIPGAQHPDASVLEAYRLGSRRLVGRYPLPTPNALCNDIALGRHGEIYVTDSGNAQVDRLDRPGGVLRVWADAAHFGDGKGFIDGIAVLGGRVLVNTLQSNQIYAVSVAPDGSAGASIVLRLSRAIDGPDGMRSHGAETLLLAESRAGRITRVDVQGDAATLTTLREGLDGGPVAVTVAGGEAWALEGQLQGLFAPPEVRKPLHPFRAIAVSLQ